MNNLFQKITPETITDYQNHLKEENLSPATAKRRLSALRKFSNWAQKEGHLEKSPFVFEETTSTIIPAKTGPGWWNSKTMKFAKITFAVSVCLILIFLLLRRFPPFLQQILVSVPSEKVVREVREEVVSPVVAGYSPWIIHFRGQISTPDGQPLTESSKIVFKIYDQKEDGESVWESKTWDLIPNPNGEFQAPIGDATRGDFELPSRLFFQNEKLYLEIIANGQTLSPRTPLSTASHAADSYLLNEFPPSQAPKGNMVPVLTPEGYLILAAPSPKIKSTSGTFGIESQAISITTSFGSGGDITLAPDQTGVLNLLFSNQSESSINAQNANLTTGVLYYGEVGNDTSDYNLIELASGNTPTTKFSVDALGNTTIAGDTVVKQTLEVLEDIDLTGNLQVGGVTRLNSQGRLTSITGYYQDSGLFKIDQGASDYAQITKSGVTSQTDLLTLSLDETGQTASNYDTLVLSRGGGTNNAYALYVSEGNVYFGDSLTVQKNLDVRGNTTLGDNSSDKVTINAGISSHLISSADSTYDLGSSSKYWANLYVDSLHTSTTLSLWQRALGAMSPLNITDDVLTGATSTASALVKLPGLTNQDAWFNLGSGNVGIGTTSPAQKLDVSGTTQMTGFKMPTGASAGYVLSSDTSGVGTWTDVSSNAGPWTLTGNNLYPDDTAYNIAIGADNTGTAKLYVNGNVGIGTTSPGSTLQVAGNITPVTTDSDLGTTSLRWDLYANLINADSTVTLTGLGTGTDNTVLILDASNNVTTDEIDSRVWGSSLVDYSGSGANYLAKFSDADTLTNSILYETGGQIGIGLTNPGSTLEVAGEIRGTKFAFQDDTDTYLDTLAADKLVLVTGNAHRLTIDSSGQVGIGTTSPGSTLQVAGNITPVTTDSDLGTTALRWDLYANLINADSTVTLTGLGTGTDNTVLILDASNNVTTDEIDSRVWGSSLVDYSGSGANYLAKFSDADTLTNSVLYETGGNIGIGTTAPANKLTVAGNMDITGNLGIGTTTPAAKLDVAGSATVSGTLSLGPNVPVDAGTCNATNKGKIYYNGTDDTLYYCNGSAWVAMGTASDITGSGAANYIPKWSGTYALTNSVLYETGGQIGIGTTAPSDKLDVVGDIEVSGVGQFGGITGTAYNAMSDSGTASYAASDDDLYIEDIFEVDGNAYLTTTYFGGGTSYGITSGGVATFNTDETINGIDINAGAVSDIDSILGNATSRFAFGGLALQNYNAISDSGTTGHGLASDDDLYIEGDVEVDGTLYADGAILTADSLYQPLYPSDDGLVGYWSFNEGTGLTAFDRSPYGNDGTLTNSPTWTTGKYGNAVEFNGTNYVSIADSNSLDVSTNFTVEVWFNSDVAINSSNDNVGLVSKNNAYGIWWQTADDGLLRFGTFGNNIRSTKSSWDASTWYHVAAVHEGNTSYIYVNGVLDNSGTNTDPVTNSANSLMIGYDEWESTYFDGKIDEVRLYSRALAADEVRSQYLHGLQSHGTIMADKFRIIDTSANVDFIVSDGLVGIGTTAPASRLHVKGSSSIASVGTSNLLTADGTFDTSTGWTVGTGWTIGSSVASHATGNTAALSGTSTATSTTTVYQVNFTVAVTTAGDGFTVSLGGKDSGNTFISAGSKTVYINPSDSSGTLAFTPGTAGTFVGTIDTVTIYAMTASIADSLIENSDGTGTPMEIRAGGHNTYGLFLGQNAGSFNTTTGGGNRGLYNTFIGNNTAAFNTTGYYNSAVGANALYSNTTGYYNSAVGNYALYKNTTGSRNSAMGSYALYSNTTGYQNSAVGDNALFSNTTGYDNSAVGNYALYANTTGYYNSAVGYFTLSANTTGSRNSAMGTNALYYNTTGSRNSAMGYSALYSNTTGYYNSAMGYYALYSNTTGYSNSAMGYYALYSNTTGYSNSAMGTSALYLNTTGRSNSAMGTNALFSNTTGYNNSAVGTNALYLLKPTSKAITAFADSTTSPGVKTTVTSASHGQADSTVVQINGTTNYDGSYTISNVTTNTFDITKVYTVNDATGWWGIISEGRANTAVGTEAGRNLVTGSGNVFLGYQAGYNETGSDKLYIDNSSTSSPLIWGDFANDILAINGNVGIGTTAPGAYKLHVEGGMIAQSYATGHLIESRIYPKEGESFAVGDLLSITNNSESAQGRESARFTKSSKSYDPNLLGVAEYNETDGFKPVFAGVFEVKISTLNGQIKAGDPITSSETLGVGMRATKAGLIIGKALEPYNNPDPNAVGKIMVFVNVSWYDPDIFLTSTGELKLVNDAYNGLLSAEGNTPGVNQNTPGVKEFGAGFKLIKDSTGEVIERIVTGADGVFARLKAGLVDAQYLIAEKGIVSPVVETEQLTASNIKTDSLETNLISPLSNDLTIQLNTLPNNASEAGKLRIVDANNNEVASINNKGTGQFKDLLAQDLKIQKDATIAGTLYAKKIVAEEIIGLESKFGQLLTSTVSATYITNNITNITQIIESTPTPLPTPTPIPDTSEVSLDAKGVNSSTSEVEEMDVEALVNEILANSLEATPQAELTGNIKITPPRCLSRQHSFSEGEVWAGASSTSEVNCAGSLTILGPTSLADTTIAGTLNVGGTMALADNSLNTLTSPLYLQSLGLGGIDILAGKIVIDKQGNIIVEGDVAVKGSLFANVIGPLPNQDLIIDLNRSHPDPGSESSNDPGSSKFGKLLIRGINDQVVASIDASGSAEFAQVATQKLIIASSDPGSEQSYDPGSNPPEITTNATAGEAVLPANKTEIKILTPHLTADSLVYITPQSDTKNKVLYVRSKATSNQQPAINYFTVAIDSPINKDIIFNWWIIN